MTAYWQEIIVALIVLGAVVYLARQLGKLLARKKAGGCAASCSQCPTNSAESRPLVSLDVPPRSTPAK